jgi:hypothetical protein
VDCLHHFCAQHLLPPPYQVLEEVDSDVVVGRQIDADVSGEEVVDLAFATVLCGELLRRDLRR